VQWIFDYFEPGFVRVSSHAGKALLMVPHWTAVADHELAKIGLKSQEEDTAPVDLQDTDGS